MNNATRVMENVEKRYEFMKYQVGCVESRPEIVPMFSEGGLLLGTRQGSQSVNVFRLLGWGETLQKAERMALRARR